MGSKDWTGGRIQERQRSRINLELKQSQFPALMKRSIPRSLCSRGLSCVPGMRIISPKAVKMTFGSRAAESPSSMRAMGRTLTGQPGP